MLEILQYKFMQHAILASIFGGVSCSLIGVFVVTMEIPFLGVTMAHAAFAGGIFGLLWGINPLIPAFIFCFLSSLLIGPIADKADFNPDTAIGIIFSIMMGVAFLGLAMIPGPKTEALSLIWGSILTISRADIILMAAISFVTILLLVLFFKEIQAVIFHREIAASVGIPERSIYYGLLFLSGAIVTTNLNTVGGLLIFSLLINPAAAAYQLTYNLKKMFILSGSFGVLSCFLGLFFSYIFNVPSGAIIIITSSVIFALALLLSPKRKVKQVGQVTEGD
ncbi:MAG: metal ABC transporter permease [Candidatus Latescibacteria bacterium]|nr:metal ABC transporter permease [Candidatus Latescibacterota bacterium]